MEIGQQFTAKSKIDKSCTTYIYDGIIDNENGSNDSMHRLIYANNPTDYIEVFVEWFYNRKLKLI